MRPAFGSWSCKLAVLALMMGLPAPGVAQGPAMVAAPADRGPLLEGDGDVLWLANPADKLTQLCRRRAEQPRFEPRPGLNAPIERIVASGNTVYAFVEEEGLWILEDEWRRGVNLPEGASVVDLFGDRAGVLALIASLRPGALARYDPRSTPETQPFDPGGAPLVVANYDARGWQALAACPIAWGTPGDGLVRVSRVRGVVGVFLAGEGGAVEHWTLHEDGQWRLASSTPALGAIRSFWVIDLAHVPVVVTATDETRTADGLQVWRLLPDVEREEVWRPATLRFSTAPEGGGFGVIADVAAFSQHVAVLVGHAPADAYLRFGRVGEEPLLGTIAVADAFRTGEEIGPAMQGVRWITPVVVFVTLLVLLIFRRDAMGARIELPASYAPALMLQRLAAMVIDLAPFALVIAAVLHVEWREGLHDLAEWATGIGSERDRFPDAETILWWFASCGLYCLYALVMELLTRRTVGKVLLGIRVYAAAPGAVRGESADGSPPAPTAWRLVIRNVFRFLELMPPAWALGFILLFSRNRQRVGDIFARTVVLRRTAPPQRRDETDGT